MKKRGETGAAAFDARYAALYGERWPSLRAALESDSTESGGRLCALPLNRMKQTMKPSLTHRAHRTRSTALPPTEPGF